MEVASQRIGDDLLAAGGDGEFGEGAVDAVEVVGTYGGGDAFGSRGPERHPVGITPHESDVFAIGCDLDDVASEQGSLAFCAGGPIENGAAGEMTAAADQFHASQQSFRFAGPELNLRRFAHDPFGVVAMQIDGCVAELAAPFDHGCIIMRMRNADVLHATATADVIGGGGIEHAEAIPKDVAFGGL